MCLWAQTCVCVCLARFKVCRLAIVGHRRTKRLTTLTYGIVTVMEGKSNDLITLKCGLFYQYFVLAADVLSLLKKKKKRLILEADGHLLEPHSFP